MKVKVYRCFENDKKEYLMSQGFEYITIALDPATYKKFWLFINDKEFDKTLLEWKYNKKSVTK